MSNACLGVLNGMVDIANRIELGQIRAGMVVACETAREINEIVIDQLLADKSMDFFKLSLATLTGGSGAVAVLLTDGSFSRTEGPSAAGRRDPERAPQFHGLCRWGIEATGRRACTSSSNSPRPTRRRADARRRAGRANLASLPRKARLGRQTQVDKVICHQVGSAHRETILKSLGIPESKDFSTFPTWGTWAPSRCR